MIFSDVMANKRSMEVWPVNNAIKKFTTTKLITVLFRRGIKEGKKKQKRKILKRVTYVKQRPGTRIEHKSNLTPESPPLNPRSGRGQAAALRPSANAQFSI